VGDEQFFEDDYKKLFNYSQEKESNQEYIEADETGKGNKQNENFSNNKYFKKDVYYEIDLLDTFENRRFTGPFIIYKLLDYWPLIDTLA
jgi:hypothetical protein